MLVDRDEIGNPYRGPSIDASYQVSVHLVERFERRRLKCEKLTEDGQWTPSDGKSSHCLWQGEINKTKRQTTIYKTLRRGGAHEGYTVTTPHLVPVVLILLQTR